MNISKYFDKNAKKRVLSSESNPEEDKKKLKEGNSTSTDNNDSVDEEVFQQLNSTTDIAEILASLKDLQTKVSDIYNISHETKSLQIKGDKQLAELAESVQHMSDRFDDLEKDRKEKEKIINELKEEDLRKRNLRKSKRRSGTV